jgi:hypothetical protein
MFRLWSKVLQICLWQLAKDGNDEYSTSVVSPSRGSPVTWLIYCNVVRRGVGIRWMHTALGVRLQRICLGKCRSVRRAGFQSSVGIDLCLPETPVHHTSRDARLHQREGGYAQDRLACDGHPRAGPGSCHRNSRNSKFRVKILAEQALTRPSTRPQHATLSVRSELYPAAIQILKPHHSAYILRHYSLACPLVSHQSTPLRYGNRFDPTLSFVAIDW